MQIIKSNPYKAVDFVESSVRKALERSGYLIADVKYDGLRGNIIVDNVAEAAWQTRTNTLVSALTHLNGFDTRWQKLLSDDRCIFPDGFMLDGELMVKGVDFNTASGLLRTKNLKKANSIYDLNGEVTGKVVKGSPFHLNAELLQVRLYAVLPIHIVESGEDYDVQNLLMPYHVEAMLGLLKEHFPEIEWMTAETYEVYDMDSLNELYEAKRAEGHEGLVIKDPQGIYRRGKKTGWWKMKPECEADGEVVGLVWGTPGLSNDGKVIGFEVLLESGRVVNACGITKAQMDEFTDKVFQFNYDNGFGDGEPKLNPYEGWAVQVLYMEETPDGSLRHPSFDKWRGTEDNPTVKV